MTTPEKINITISTISAIATVAAAIIYFKTLKTLRKQTSNTYRPHLFIDTIGFSVLGVKQGNIVMPTYWADPDVEQNTIHDFNQNQNNHNFSLKCYNIGFGTAKKVTVKFNYDHKSLIEKINELKKHVEKNKVIEIESTHDMILFKPTNKNLPYLNHAISFKNTLNDYQSYILPVNISNTYAPIQIPMLYPELLNIFVFYLSIAKKSDDFNLDDYFPNSLPKLNCLITYEDIFNKPQKLEMEITVSIHAFGVSGYRGQFNVKEK